MDAPNVPTLTPQFCFSTVVLRDFLRASRAVDDTITQHLNALVTPARAGFDPTSTAHRTATAAPASYGGQTPSQSACRAFQDAVLFPAWQSRDEVIRYCTRVADAAVASEVPAEDVQETAETVRNRDNPERFDPYVRRKQFAQAEPQADLLAALMRQEQGVETIVRARSWDVLQGRCSAALGGDAQWETALERWRRREGR